MAEKTRTFIAIDLPKESFPQVKKLQEKIEQLPFEGKMTQLENIHLTLKFLGELTPAQLDQVKTQLQKLTFKPISLVLGEVGTFKNNRGAAIIWIEVKGCEEIQKKIDSVLSDQFQAEKRFMGHMTLARIKKIANKEEFSKKMKQLPKLNEKLFIEKIKLKKSRLATTGPTYTTLEILFAT